MTYSSSPKTVLHLIDTTGPGGAERVFVDVADRMRGEGYESIVAIRGPGWVNDELIRRGLEPLIIPSKGSFNLKFLLSLLRLIKARKVGLIHSHLLGSNVYAALAGMITRVPVIGTYHGMVDLSPSERFSTLKRFVMKKGISRYVAVSEHLAQDIASRNLLEIENTIVIFNGIDVLLYGKKEQRPIVSQLGIPVDATLVGSVGNVRPAKAYEVLIEVAAQVLKENPNTHFLIVGDKKKSLMELLNCRLALHNIAENVHFLGFTDDTAEFLSQLDVFFLCSSSEGFSISTVEAMASELPIVATRCGGPEEIIQDGKTGLMVDVGAAEDMAEAIVRVISNTGLVAELGSNARKHAQENFDMKVMLQCYRDLYESLY